MKNNSNQKILLEESWLQKLQDEFQKEYMLELRNFLQQEQKQFQIFPPMSQIFNAFFLTPFQKVKVIILGQDPYHGVGQAHGLSFSVPDKIKPPPSLKNIYKEINKDLNLPIAETGNLTKWAKQGVLLLNSVLTVRKSSPASHRDKGWEIFTDKVISILSEKRQNLVFLLWGSYAKSKKDLIDQNKHLILEGAHPSPYSVSGFLGKKYFSKANDFLNSKNIEVIDWKL